VDVIVLVLGPPAPPPRLPRRVTACAWRCSMSSRTPAARFIAAVPREFSLAETSRTPDHRLGDAIRAALAASPVVRLFGRRVWLAEPGFTVKAVGPAGLETHSTPRIIVATGTRSASCRSRAGRCRA